MQSVGGKGKKIELSIDRPLALREILKMGGVDPASSKPCNNKMLSMDEAIQPGDSIKLLRLSVEDKAIRTFSIAI